MGAIVDRENIVRNMEHGPSRRRKQPRTALPTSFGRTK
jgi:hypothetical protein